MFIYLFFNLAGGAIVTGENEYYSYYTYSNKNDENLELVRGCVGMIVMSIVLQVWSI